MPQGNALLLYSPVLLVTLYQGWNLSHLHAKHVLGPLCISLTQDLGV